MAKVLVVDDEPTIVLLMRVVFEKAGHEVTTALNGQEALALLGIEPDNPAAPLPDVVLLDIMMPIVDGFTVAGKMRTHPRASRVPILVSTAKGDMRDLFKEMPQVVGFFQKPCDPRVLREAVEKAVANNK